MYSTGKSVVAFLSIVARSVRDWIEQKVTKSSCSASDHVELSVVTWSPGCIPVPFEVPEFRHSAHQAYTKNDPPNETSEGIEAARNVGEKDGEKDVTGGIERGQNIEAEDEVHDRQEPLELRRHGCSPFPN